jgi:hypothetical protein
MSRFSYRWREGNLVFMHMSKRPLTLISSSVNGISVKSISVKGL